MRCVLCVRVCAADAVHPSRLVALRSEPDGLFLRLVLVALSPLGPTCKRSKIINQGPFGLRTGTSVAFWRDCGPCAHINGGNGPIGAALLLCILCNRCSRPSDLQLLARRRTLLRRAPSSYASGMLCARRCRGKRCRRVCENEVCEQWWFPQGTIVVKYSHHNHQLSSCSTANVVDAELMTANVLAALSVAATGSASSPQNLAVGTKKSPATRSSTPHTSCGRGRVLEALSCTPVP